MPSEGHDGIIPPSEGHDGGVFVLKFTPSEGHDGVHLARARMVEERLPSEGQDGSAPSEGQDGAGQIRPVLNQKLGGSCIARATIA